MFEVDFTLSSCCAPQSHGVFVVKRDIGRVSRSKAGVDFCQKSIRLLD